MGYQVTKEMILEFCTQLQEEEKSTKTIEKYKRDLFKFAEFMGDREITKKEVMLYKEDLQNHYEICSVNSMIASVNRFLKMNGFGSCIVRSVRIQRGAFREERRELTKDEYYALLSAARTHNKRLYYIMETLASTGIRISELRYITVEALMQRHAVVSAKGKRRTVLLPQALCEELLKYAYDKKIQTGKVFITRTGTAMDRSNIYHEMKKLCIDAGVEDKKVFPHNFRHLFAVSFFESCKDLPRLADVLGHSNINTTRIYTQVSSVKQEEIIDNLHFVLRSKNKKQTMIKLQESAGKTQNENRKHHSFQHEASAHPRNRKIVFEEWKRKKRIDSCNRINHLYFQHIRYLEVSSHVKLFASCTLYPHSFSK